MNLRIAVFIFMWISSELASAGKIPCSLKKFSAEIDEQIDTGLSIEEVREVLIDSYGIEPAQIAQHTYEIPLALNNRKGRLSGVKSRLNVILKQCHPMSAFFFETWFSAHYYFDDEGELINDEYFYTVDAL